MRIGCIIPTRNAGDRFGELLLALQKQSAAPACVYVIDSGSSDNTAALAKQQVGHCVEYPS